MDPVWGMAGVLMLGVVAVVLYAIDRMPMEYVSLGVIVSLLTLFSFFPLIDAQGSVLSPSRLLQGFASPALFAVIGLLVVGQGLVQTGSLNRIAQTAVAMGDIHPAKMVMMILFIVLVSSAFLNNTPVVIIFIPILQALAARSGASASLVMMPLSFAAILGGMTTLIGSSTNILVSTSLEPLGQKPFGFFEFTVPGMFLASIGLLYVLFVAPRLLPDRASLTRSLLQESGKQFIAQITVREGSKLVGETARAGLFPELQDMTVRLVLRGERAMLPPFDDFSLQAGDVLVVAATRKALTEMISRGAGVVGADYSAQDGPQAFDGKTDVTVLSEVMVTPASRLIGLNLERVGFRYRFHSIVLGIQRHARMIRTRMNEIPLEAGDILLIQGRQRDIRALRESRDVLPIEHSEKELPVPGMALRANIIFLFTVLLAATETLPVMVAAMGGAAAMLFFGVLNIRQAGRAVDRNLVLLVGASLALGIALQETGGAEFLARQIIVLFGWGGPVMLLSGFFLLVAILTNIISNNACAVIFTPIAVNLANSVGADPMVYAVAVIFAANCSFVTPIGYQTNLLVMGPGHYRFGDFLKVGAPLTLLIWLTFSLFAPWYYGL